MTLHRSVQLRSNGFTLVEFLIVIGIVGMIGSLVIVNADNLIRGLGEEKVEQTLRNAIREARFQAGYLKERTSVFYNEETASFVISGPAGAELANFPTRFSDSPSNLDIDFFQLLPGKGLRIDDKPERASIPVVFFREDRSSTPFEVELSFEQSSFRLRFDPFSDIVIKDSREN